MREYRFDVARVVCMTYIVAFMHLYAYIYPEGRVTFYIPACKTMTDACLGLFTFVSGYLLGRKYLFGSQGNSDVWTFYRKRLLRIIPLFVVASIVLWLIGFNGTEPTLNGLLCISPFVSPKPRTLWYIPVILWCYLLTPLVSRRDQKWRIGSSLGVFALLLVARYLFPSVDGRLIFNLFFYLAGIIIVNQKPVAVSPAFKLGFVLLFVLLVAVGLYRSLLFRPSFIMAVGGVGVFAILYVCEAVSKLIYDGQGVRQNHFSRSAAFVVSAVSYASMACYMFHRLFYWLAESTWTPTDPTWKWLFMAGLVYPVMLVGSYFIQKWYDRLAKRI